MSIEQEALKRIRESEELGRGSCSTVDECQTDEELLEEIRGIIKDYPSCSSESIFNYILETERIRQAYADDIRGA